MRKLVMCAGVVVGLVAIAACAEAPVVVVRLSGASFGTTGGNLFNCGSPAEPSDANGLSGDEIVCNPERAADGSFSTTPVTVKTQMGCGDGHGALVGVTCAGTGNGTDVTATVTLSITTSCNDKEDVGASPSTFAVADLAPGAASSSPGPLESCAVFDDLCGSSNACAFNDWNATISVTNMAK
jgi:hypothetical protein